MLLALVAGMSGFMLSSGLPSGTGTPPASAQTPGDMQVLQQNIAAAVANSGIDAAVAVTDLQTGETIGHRGHEPRLPGCVINFFVLLQAVQDVQNGRYGEHRIGDLISRTVYSSNPVTARELLLIAADGNVDTGMQRVSQLMASIGISASVYDHPPAYPHESRFGSANLLTPIEMNMGLSALWHGQVVNFQWRDYLLEKMTGSKPGLKYLIPAGVGDGRVHHKIGFFPHPNGTWVDADAGIVTFWRGGQPYAYAISFFAQGIPSEYADVPVGQQVSRLAWDFFNARYGGG